tara:strand:- start:666 stop:1547 length:882 start_codon:yes stop_codon:yes gene_type:complete
MYKTCILLVLLITIVYLKSIYKNTTSLNDFESHRIGNLIDSWYFGSLGSTERIKHFNEIQQKCGKQSFGAFLKLGEGVSFLQPRIKNILVNESNKIWALYNYDNIKLAMPNIRTDLCERFDMYIRTKRPHLISDIAFSSKDLTIHYRLGDFVKLGQTIDISSLVVACKRFNVQFSNIYILDGGKSHDTSKEDMTNINIKYEELLKQLYSAFPSSTVREISGTDSDEDLYIMSKSPYLVTAAGSFAICGAILNRHGYIYTPASKSLNFPYKGLSPESQIAYNWHTYAYSIKALH